MGLDYSRAITLSRSSIIEGIPSKYVSRDEMVTIAKSGIPSKSKASYPKQNKRATSTMQSRRGR